MSPLRSILVQLDASPAARDRLATAVAIGQRHEACVLGMYVAAACMPALPAGRRLGHRDSFEPDGNFDSRQRIRGWFEGEARRDDRLAMRWVETQGDEATEAFVRQALLADLSVVASRREQKDASDSAAKDFAESLLMATGKPALVMPTDIRSVLPRRRASTIVVAWDGRPPAARALASALPWLALADKVHTVEAYEEYARERVGAIDVAQYLRLHGIAPVRHCKRLEPADAGDALLCLAADVGADLLVMGCYGRSSLRERFFGGATRHVLQAARIPVWMVH